MAKGEIRSFQTKSEAEGCELPEPKSITVIKEQTRNDESSAEGETYYTYFYAIHGNSENFTLIQDNYRGISMNVKLHSYTAAMVGWNK